MLVLLLRLYLHTSATCSAVDLALIAIELDNAIVDQIVLLWISALIAIEPDNAIGGSDPYF